MYFLNWQGEWEHIIGWHFGSFYYDSDGRVVTSGFGGGTADYHHVLFDDESVATTPFFTIWIDYPKTTLVCEISEQLFSISNDIWEYKWEWHETGGDWHIYQLDITLTPIHSLSELENDITASIVRRLELEALD